MRYVPELYFKSPAEMRALFRGLSGSHCEHARDRGALQSRARIRHFEVSGISGARRQNARRLLARALSPGLARTLRRTRGDRRRVDQAARLRARRAREDRVRQLFPDRLGFHPLRERERGIPVGPGPRFGGRLDGRLCDGDYRHRSAPVRSALRALSESGTRFAAGYRRRFLRIAPRRSDRIRAAEIWRAPGLADHHLRHARAKSVVRDVGRVMGWSYGDADRIAKMIPNELNITLDRPRRKIPS